MGDDLLGNELASNFSKLSLSYSKSIPKKERKDNGIYFTPKKAREELFEMIAPYFCTTGSGGLKILEPSFGSGEFIKDIQTKYPTSSIVGIERHEELFKSVSKNDNTILKNMDFLEFKNSSASGGDSEYEKFHLIIGNPPYYGTKIKNTNCMKGKGNVFVLFIYKCLKHHLEKDGILAFVLPTSFYNSDNYQECRNFIRAKTTIVGVKDIDVKYVDTTQNTMLLVIKNSTDGARGEWFFKDKYITPYYKELSSLVENTVTIKELGFKVKTGEVVWNENKNKLVNKEKPADPGTLVIYSSNISDNHRIDIFEEGLSKEKKQYIINCKKPVNSKNKKYIVIPRGYGNVYQFNYAIIDNIGEDFYGENHINIIYCDDETNSTQVCDRFDRIKKSFQDPRTIEFVKMFVGNGALSKTEIENILPIF
jgi:16S rRNA G966 N2-methylase RsmD